MLLASLCLLCMFALGSSPSNYICWFTITKKQKLYLVYSLCHQILQRSEAIISKIIYKIKNYKLRFT
jgi:hypothetical protein